MKTLFGCFVTLYTILPIALPAQTNGTIQYDGLTRDYIVYLPPSFSPSVPVPLVFVLHGFTQSAASIMNVTGFNALSDANGFVVAYPNGVGNAWNTNSGFPGGSTADDIGFIGALIDTLHLLYNIDTTRVYSCGFSAGGYMSHRLACESQRCFAAVASVSGTMSNNAFNDCNPIESTPVLQIHGTSDLVVFYNGGFGGKSVDDVIGKWVGVNGCQATPAVTMIPDINTNDGSTVEKYEHSPCSTGSTVLLYKVNGGGHQWPGTQAAAGGIGNINQDISATQEIWNFFSGYTCSFSTNIAHVEHASPPFSCSIISPGIFQLGNSGIESDQVRVTVSDMYGRTVESGNWYPAGSETFNISLFDAAQGHYLIMVTGKKGIDSFRIFNP
jgi:polyhydroxybutyrate depolymerase